MLQVKRFFRQSRILLWQSRTLLRHYCWCGRGFSLLRLYCSRDIYFGL